jgi:hypothetical protein
MNENKTSRPPPRQHAFESQVLSKTRYEIPHHPPESLDWLNVLLGQLLSKYRSDEAFSTSVLKVLDEGLNGNQRPPFLVHYILYRHVLD